MLLYINDILLQVDFAAAHIGGGVLRGGAVQEEIRFCICPELLVSILITDTMEDNEAILMTGHERFSYYDGYSATFKFTGDCEDPSEVTYTCHVHVNYHFVYCIASIICRAKVSFF